MTKNSMLAPSFVVIQLLALGIAGCAVPSDTTEPAPTEETGTVQQAATGTFLGCRGTGLSVCTDLVSQTYFNDHPSCTPTVGCAGQHYACDTTCPAPTTKETSFTGCRGNGYAVCDELVDPSYYGRNPSCTPNDNCGGAYFACNAACPQPTVDETPNAFIKAAGAVTSYSNIVVGATWTADGTGGGYTATVESDSPVSEFLIGVGVHVFTGDGPFFQCYSDDPTTKISTAVIKWTNGATQTIACNSQSCGDIDLPPYGGFTVTCNYVTQ